MYSLCVVAAVFATYHAGRPRTWTFRQIHTMIITTTRTICDQKTSCLSSFKKIDQFLILLLWSDQLFWPHVAIVEFASIQASL